VKGRNQRELSEKKVPFLLFGQTCDSGDKIGTMMLPEDIQDGDLIHVPTAGAYTDSTTSEFNGFGAPRYVGYDVWKPRSPHYKERGGQKNPPILIFS